MNGKAIIVRSFARIHEANLKKQGVLALTFADPDDYERVLVDDTVEIVGLADLSVGGAFLRTSATAIVAVGERHVLRLLLLPDRTEFEIRAEVVRVVESQESDDHPRGVAVRFLDTDEPLRQKILAFIERGILLQA